MPKLLFARAPHDGAEERQVRKLAGSRHAPGDWILRARIIVRSWGSQRTTHIAQELGCHPQTVRERILRFNAEGIEGLGDQPGSGRRPRLTEGATILCLDELGPVSPRTFPPASGWSGDGHRLKAPLDRSRGPDKVWVYGALRPQDGQVHTFTAPSRNTAGFLRLLADLDAANPEGDLYLINDNLSSHTSGPIRDWLAAHPRVQQEPLPTGACWLNLIEGWWRLFRRAAFAGQSFADHTDIEHATTLATRQLNRRAKPWRWGRPPPQHRRLRRRFAYLL